MDMRQGLIERIDNDRDILIAFLSSFLQAESPNPPGDTRAAARCVTDFLEARDLTHRVIAPEATMPNIVASLDGAQSGRHLVLNGHIDVFPAAGHESWTHGPWSGDVADGHI